ncbi:aminotransferase class IV [Fluviispira sanaruensis]|uniref:Cytochrome c551 n=1 Tax=Fluviispira sanaruensis TaxID=2493639 RepID=A0A4P2VGW4_FLUSA|nr:aminotransferase class IV [Fluviispira sanaruensis]BBH52086.1 cytochrome c551 [Fluviispira sanaruensis]
MSNQHNGISCINGIFTPINEAKIPISDRGFLFCHSIFETLLVKGDKIISWESHFERMKLSCESSFIKIPDENLLKDWCQHCAEINYNLSDPKPNKVQLRIIVTGGNSFDLGIKRMNETLPNPNVIIICRNTAGPSQDQYMQGISLKCLPDLRAQGLIDIKSCSYLYNLMCLEMAKKEGYNDALFYNNLNLITESTTANFIWFDEKNNVNSAPFKGSCLAGTTLSKLIQGMQKTNLLFTWKELNLKNLAEATGCGIISSIRGIVPVNKIDTTHFDIHSQKKLFEKLNKVLEEQME